MVLAQHIMSFWKGLACPGMIAPTQVPVNPPIAYTVLKPVREVGNDTYFRPFLCSMMTGDEHDKLTKFSNLNTPIFCVGETKDAYELIFDCYERLHRLGIVTPTWG